MLDYFQILYFMKTEKKLLKYLLSCILSCKYTQNCPNLNQSDCKAQELIKLGRTKSEEFQVHVTQLIYTSNYSF